MPEVGPKSPSCNRAPPGPAAEARATWDQGLRERAREWPPVLPRPLAPQLPLRLPAVRCGRLVSGERRVLLPGPRPQHDPRDDRGRAGQKEHEAELADLLR